MRTRHLKTKNELVFILSLCDVWNFIVFWGYSQTFISFWKKFFNEFSMDDFLLKKSHDHTARQNGGRYVIARPNRLLLSNGLKIFSFQSYTVNALIYWYSYAVIFKHQCKSYTYHAIRFLWNCEREMREECHTCTCACTVSPCFFFSRGGGEASESPQPSEGGVRQAPEPFVRGWEEVPDCSSCIGTGRGWQFCGQTVKNCIRSIW